MVPKSNTSPQATASIKQMLTSTDTDSINYFTLLYYYTDTVLTCVRLNHDDEDDDDDIHPMQKSCQHFHIRGLATENNLLCSKVLVHGGGHIC